MSDLEYKELSPLGKDRPAPEATIWATSTDMAGSEHERKTYFIKLVDGDTETKFSLQIHADKTIVAVPYVDVDYNYYDYDDWGDDDDDVWEEDDSYYDDDEEDDWCAECGGPCEYGEESYDGVIYYEAVE
jgi:hypothetical protein